MHMTGGVTDGKDWQQRMAHVQENLRRMDAGEPQLAYESNQPFTDYEWAR
jgi:hypothetical protein